MTALLIACVLLLICNSYISVRSYFLLSLLDEEFNELLQTTRTVEKQYSPEVGLDKRLQEIQTAKFAVINRKNK